MITDQDRELWRDLARRICGAWISYRLHLRSVDYTLKQYVPEDRPISDLWIEIAMKVHEYARDETHKNIFGSEEPEKDR